MTRVTDRPGGPFRPVQAGAVTGAPATRRLHVAPAGGGLFDAAAAVLARNDLGGRTKAAPALYPHQWSWDSAFVAIGLARLDPARAAAELSSLFAHQWDNGKVPHIVYDPAAPEAGYWPASRHWICCVPDDPPPGVVAGTSGLIQPPVHAIAAERVWHAALRGGGAAADDARRWLAGLYPRLWAWHRYLHTLRDPDRTGLVSIYHPWESGMDNSPRWDAPLERVAGDESASVERPDVRAVGDPRERPSDAAYRRFAALVHRLRADCYDDVAAQRHHPFVVKDVFASGILVAADHALLRLAAVLDAPAGDRAALDAWARRGRRGVLGAVDAATGVAFDFDVRAGRWLPARTVAGFAPLIAGVARGQTLQRQLAALHSPAFLGHPRLAWPLPPSVAPTEASFDPRSYWRGPVWPVITWLLWWALRRARRQPLAARLRHAALAQLAATGGFPEYVHPFTGDALGSADQSWTAAVALDWLAADGAHQQS